MDDFISLQDFLEEKINNGNIKLDDNRTMFDCSNFNFSNKRIMEINDYIKKVSGCKTLSQQENKSLFEKFNSELDSITKENIKSEIFFGNQKLIQNYLVWKNKYPVFESQDINDMIYEGQRLLLDAIDNYNNTYGFFSTYLFNCFKLKIKDDFLETIAKNETKSLENTQPDIENKLNGRLNDTPNNLVKRLKGKSIKFYPCHKNCKIRYEMNDFNDQYFKNLDYYDIEELEKGKTI